MRASQRTASSFTSAYASLKYTAPLTNPLPCCSNTREAWSDIWPATIGVAVMFITSTLLLIKVTADLVHARRDYHMYHDYMYNNDAVTAAISTAYDTGDKGSYMRNVSSTAGSAYGHEFMTCSNEQHATSCSTGSMGDVTVHVKHSLAVLPDKQQHVRCL